MLRLAMGDRPTSPLRILCIGAHSDDIEIGCGGTLLRLLAERPGSTVHWAVLSATGEREREARDSAAAFLVDAASVCLELQTFRESYFPYVGADIKDWFNDLRARVEPDLVLCHHRGDQHQDHRTVAQLVWNTFRNHLIAEFEIAKYEGDLGWPNLYVQLSQTLAEHKVDLIMTHFSSQRTRYWFRPETFMATMALRGVEAGGGYAEAFHVRKLVV